MSPPRASNSSAGLVHRTFATLRAGRYAVYLGGLAVVVAASTVAPAWTRTPLVVAALTAMCVTYLAELHGRAGVVRGEAVVTAVAVAGVAVGTYVLVAVHRVGGALFVLGGVLFFRAATGDGDD
ncbi:hypothetical protein [Salinigranum marinum]|uniref:hypothetical protein n=1 Tax=Salinigranum marinum TaxID=1515595 RepID=UPI00298A0502|nr:hypothetical protein [Salinigranum marinum]